MISAISSEYSRLLLSKSAIFISYCSGVGSLIYWLSSRRSRSTGHKILMMSMNAG